MLLLMRVWSKQHSWAFQALANTSEGGSALEEIIQEQWYECVSEFEDTDSSNRKGPSPQLMRRYDFSRDSVGTS